MSRVGQATFPLADPRPRFSHPGSMVWANHAERRVLIRYGLLLAAVFVGLAAAHVWIRLQVLEVRYRLGAAQQVWTRLDAEHDALVAELARVEEAENILAMARARLGLSRPEPTQEAYLP